MKQPNFTEAEQKILFDFHEMIRKLKKRNKIKSYIRLNFNDGDHEQETTILFPKRIKK